MTRLARVSALLLVPVAFGACSWFTDFKEQPKIDPWESASDTMPYRGNPQGSVPTVGTRVPGFAVSYAPLPPTVDSMKSVANPTPADARSLLNGRKYYQINCAVCHGPAALGNGPATKYGVPSIMLVTPQARGYTDGYIYGMIRNGRGMMPSYNRIEDLDRWDVVNYLRALQALAVGGAGAAPVDTTPVGLPGQTGATLPGPTMMGPTRPAPWYGPHRAAAPAEVPAAPAAPAAPDSAGTARRDTTPTRPTP